MDISAAYSLMQKAKDKADEKARYNRSGRLGDEARKLYAIFKYREKAYLRLKEMVENSS